MARAGSTIAILVRDEEGKSAALAALPANAVPVMAPHLGVTKRDTLADAMDQVERELGCNDVLVSNAGVVVVSGAHSTNQQRMGTRSWPRTGMPAFCGSTWP